jgi:hypothetical protein
VGGTICQMIFLVVNTDNYDLFFRLNFFINIRAVVDVEKGVIQVRNEHIMEVEVLPLNVVNMLQVFERSKRKNAMSRKSCSKERWDSFRLITKQTCWVH